MRKIDGRKAVITDNLQRWSSFERLADKLGYPDAAVPSAQDKRTRPRNGDVVTVLSSVDERGEIVVNSGQRIFIVEAANGERHIYGEKGLRILDEEVTGITVLKDESLSDAGHAVEREYREVNRKADVGELVKIVDGVSFSDYENGDIFVVERVDSDREIYITDNAGDKEGVHFHEYITLEPTDIVRIKTPNSDGKTARFRMVDRKAAVGERVIIIDAQTATDAYRNGDIMTVNRAGYAKDGVYTDETWVFVYRSEYRVLEPVESAESAQQSEPLSAKPAPDQAAEIIAALTTRVAALEKRVAALEAPKSRPATDEEVADVLRLRLGRPVCSGVAKVSRAKSPQEIRDDIVKRAKEDVAKLSVSRVDNVPTIGGNRATFRMGMPFMDTVRFEVNADKRTVVALLFTHDGYVWARGIAKCAPGDVFNSHIGRAIALRRALGLEIPEEYVSAPQPTEVRVGDIVRWTNAYDATSTEVSTVTEIDDERYWLSCGGFDDKCTLTVLDDSREDSAEPRKEVA